MPRQTKAAKPQPNAIVASAAKVIAGRRKNIPTGTSTAWQNEAWEMLDTVGELEFYREWMAHAGSMCTLKAVEDYLDEDGAPAVRDAQDPEVLAAMAALFGGENGQPEMLGTMFGHLAVPGETWLCGLLNPPETADAPDTWRVLERGEVQQQGNRWQIDRGDGEPEKYADGEVYLVRIWEPHPRKWVHANSSVRSALPILRELVGLSKRTAANIDSRLAGAGLLVVPQEVTFSSPVSSDGTGEDDAQIDPFMAALIEAMITPIEDRGDASALVPLVIKAPAEHLDKIKHISLSTPLDEKAQSLREELLKRLANSLDIPAEVLTGMADVNHWTGWLLDENAIKMHVQPILGTITRGLTTRYLWPILQGEDNPTLDPALRRFRIVGETSKLRQRPNRAAEATQAHKDMVITNTAWAREVGFEEVDLLDPESEEFKIRLLQRIAGGVTTADLTAAAVNALGVPITPVASDVATEEALETGSGSAPEPPVLEAPQPEPTDVDRDAATGRELPTQDSEPPAIGASAGGPSREQLAALLAVSENLTLRAVEKGWNRAGRRGRIRKPVPQDQLDAALSDAWSTVDRNAALLGVDSHRLRDALDTYARALLATGAEHDANVLVRLIEERVLDQPTGGSVSSAVVAALGYRSQEPERPEREPINLTVQVSPPDVSVNLPAGLVAAAAAPVMPAPQVTVNVPEQAAPQVNVNVEPTPVTVENRVEVEPTPVTVEATVEAPQVTVEMPAPEVTVTVEPTPVEVTVEQPKPRTIKRRILRDAEGNITGTEETS